MPLEPGDADEMVAVLADECLHEFIGGRPDTLAELRERYARLAAGSRDAGEVWLAGLEPTHEEADGERVWRTAATTR